MPAPIDGYTTGKVLTMEYVVGTKVTTLSPLTRLDINAPGLADTLVRAYLKQIIIDGIFHADPHPGNVLLMPDGRLALIDLGMVGRISPIMQERLLKLLLAVSEGRGDEAAEVTVALCDKLDTYDDQAFRHGISAIVGRHAHESLGNLQVGRVFMEVQLACATHGLRAPAELTMLGKTLLNLDHVARTLSPEMDVNATIRRDAGALMARRLQKSATSGGLFSAVLEAKEFAERLPGRVNRVLDALSSSELKLKVELIDEGAVMDGLQKGRQPHHARSHPRGAHRRRRHDHAGGNHVSAVWLPGAGDDSLPDCRHGRAVAGHSHHYSRSRQQAPVVER